MSKNNGPIYSYDHVEATDYDREYWTVWVHGERVFPGGRIVGGYSTEAEAKAACAELAKDFGGMVA